MNSPSPLDAKEMVRQAVDIVDLVGEAYELRRQGRNYVCRCPWHDDTRPSLTVNQERQSWRCWVCYIGGDIFSWVMRRDGVEFREALETLAERAGIELKPTHNRPAEAGGPGDKKTLFAAMAWAESQFHRHLLEDPGAADARQYLADRQINHESIERFHIGYAPDRWDWLRDRAIAKGFSTAVLARVGLSRERQSGGGHYDFFRGRVMFPICDMQARPVAFGGRILPKLSENAGGKYVNSPETPLYSKSNQLYAMNLARDAVQKEGMLAVMEGYTDVVMAHQHGLCNVVAVCGTALGEQHLKLIRRLTEKVALVLDGDEAGQRRASEVLELFVGNQVDLRILTLPENLDPCDFIATPKEGPKEGFGVDAFRELLNRAPDALQHKLDLVTNGLVSYENTHDASRAAEELLATLARAAGGGLADSAAMIREQSILTRLANRLRLPLEQLRVRLNAIRTEQSKKPLASRQASQQASPHASQHEQPYDETFDAPEYVDQYDEEPYEPTKLTASDQELLELMLLDAECARRIAESVPETRIESRLGRAIFQCFRDAMEEHGSVEFSWLMSTLTNEQYKSTLVALDEASQEKSGSDRQQRLEDLLARCKDLDATAQRQRHKAALAEKALDEDQELEALGDIFATLKNRQTGSSPTEG